MPGSCGVSKGLWDSPAEARGAGGAAVGRVRPAVIVPPPAGVCALRSGLHILGVGLDAVALGVAASVHGCAQTADVSRRSAHTEAEHMGESHLSEPAPSD